MTLEEQQYYETYFDTFASDGWKQYINEIKEILDSYRIEDIKDEKQLQYVKGERSALYRVLRFETGVKTAYDMILEREAKYD